MLKSYNIQTQFFENRSLFFLLVALLFSFSLCLSAQIESFHFHNDWSVQKESMILNNAWAGGLDNAQFSSIDYNQDGWQDLFVFDKSGNSCATFLNNGNNGSQESIFFYAPTYQADFPVMRDWALLFDFDGDGLADIFTYYNGGVRVFKATLNEEEEPDWIFEKLTDKLRYTKTNNNTAILPISRVDIPSFIDVDEDGDMDILTFDSGGGFVEFFANQSQELYNHSDSLLFTLEDPCWGKFFENGLTNSIDFDVACKGKSREEESTSRLHSGSTLMAYDKDGDGDKELLLGDVSFSTMNLLTNGGDLTQAQMVSQDTLFPANSVKLDLYTFPAAFYLDCDNDGLKDLLAAPNDEIFYENTQNVWSYKNVGTADEVIFDFQQNDFLVGEMIDIGTEAFPVWVDVNGDALLDMVIGGVGLFDQEDIQFDAALTLYLNTGSLEIPSFEWQSDDWGAVAQYQLGGTFPCFGDLDADGDVDLLLGDQGGNLHYLKNTGSMTEAIFEMEQASFLKVPDGLYAVPYLYDWNEDGQLDLILGERAGKLSYFENVSDAGLDDSLRFDLVQDFWGGVDVRQDGFPDGYSVPQIIEEAGEKYLLVNSNQGDLFLYTDLEETTFTLVDNDFSQVTGSGKGGLSLADVNGDEYLDMLLGNARGGVHLLSQNPKYNGIKEVKINYSLFELYPNPARDYFIIQLEENGASFYSTNKIVQVFDLMGNLLLEKPMEGNWEPIDVTGLKAGLYLVNLKIDGQKTTVKKLIVF